MLISYESAYAEKVYPGVSVLGMPMAGMSRSEAEISLTQRFSQTYRQSLTLRYGDRVWPVTRDEIGLRFHVAKTLAAAMAPGRTGNLAGQPGRAAPPAPAGPGRSSPCWTWTRCSGWAT